MSFHQIVPSPSTALILTMILTSQTPQPIMPFCTWSTGVRAAVLRRPGQALPIQESSPMTSRAGPTSSLAFEFCLVGSIGSQKALLLLLPALTSVAQTTVVRKYVPPVRRQQRPYSTVRPSTISTQYYHSIFAAS